MVRSPPPFALVVSSERRVVPRARVLFELPASALQLDVAIVDDDGRFGELAPSQDSKKRGDEVRLLAWRLWTTRSPYLWLIAPGDRRAYERTYEPFRLTPLPALPQAAALHLADAPASAVVPSFGA
jgi:hypothetical protein